MALERDRAQGHPGKHDTDQCSDARLVTGMRDPQGRAFSFLTLRSQILVLLNERVASRPEICRELGAPRDSVKYEVEVMTTANPPLVELVYEKPVRGTVEKFFRATTLAYLDPSEWPGVPDPVKARMRGSLLDMIVRDAVTAVSEGTYDSLENAHMSWTPMILDQQGWDDLFEILLRALEEAVEVKEDSAERLLAADAEGTSCTVSILGYASANTKRKVGPSGLDDAGGTDEDPDPQARKSKTKRAPTRKSATKKASSKRKGKSAR